MGPIPCTQARIINGPVDHEAAPVGARCADATARGGSQFTAKEKAGSMTLVPLFASEHDPMYQLRIQRVLHVLCTAWILYASFQPGVRRSVAFSVFRSCNTAGSMGWKKASSNTQQSAADLVEKLTGAQILCESTLHSGIHHISDTYRRPGSNRQLSRAGVPPWY